MPALNLPIRDRAFEVEKSAVSEDKRTVSFIFASETPVRCWDYELGEHFEILDCRDGSGDLSLLRNNGALLVQHDPRVQIGVHERAEFTTDPVKGRVGTATARFGNSAKAKEEFDDVKDGIRSKFSVRYQPVDMVLERAGEDGDFYRVTKWRALENSLVSMPADDNCSTTRNENVETATVQIHNPHNLQPMKIRNRNLFFNKPDDGGAGGGQTCNMTPAETTEVESRLRKQVQEDFTRRHGEINDLVIAVRKRDKKDFAELGQKMLLEGKGANDFARAIATSDEYKPFDAEPIGGDVDTTRADGSRPEDQRRGLPSIYLPGDVFVRSEAFKKLGAKVGTRRSVSVETPEFLAGRTRATMLSTGLTGITKSPGVVELGARRLTVKDLIAPGQTGTTTIRYIREVAVANTSGMVAEGAAKPEQSFDFEEVDAVVRKIAAWTKVSDELFRDYLAVASTINMRLPYMVELTEEAQLLNGDGTGQSLTGIMQTAGLLTQARGADSNADALYRAQTQIRTSGLFGGGYEPDGYIIHPLDWETLRLAKDENGQYYAGGPFTAAYGNDGGVVLMDMIWGKPVVVSPAMTQGTALCGAFKLGAQYFQREGMMIDTTNCDQDDFIKNQMTIRAELSLALAVYRPSAFCQITGLGA